MLRGFVSAIRTLTAFPIPGRDAENLASALPFFPIVGLIIGGIMWGAAYATGLLAAEVRTDAVAFLLVFLGIISTRALHLDGLADWADGFWGGKNREDTLRIMKDPCVGTFGTTAIVCLILVKWLSIAALLDEKAAIWVVAACVVSRTMQVDLLVFRPYARTDGGTAAPFSRRASSVHYCLAFGLATAILFVLFSKDLLWLAVLIEGCLIAKLFGFWCYRRVGGITGDLLGACNELVEAAILITCAFCAGNCRIG
jgi:adenosylcobinamide-GDP ribazoletransferase